MSIRSCEINLALTLELQPDVKVIMVPLLVMPDRGVLLTSKLLVYHKDGGGFASWIRQASLLRTPLTAFTC